jgi:hypothetical protein
LYYLNPELNIAHQTTHLMHLKLRKTDLTIPQIEASLRKCFPSLNFHTREQNIINLSGKPDSEMMSATLTMYKKDGRAVQFYLYKGDIYMKATWHELTFWKWLRNLFSSAGSADMRDEAVTCLKNSYGGDLWTQSEGFR